MNGRNIIASIVERITFRRIRFMWKAHAGVNDMRWVWTPWTDRFDHSGWIFLDLTWLRRFWTGA